MAIYLEVELLEHTIPLYLNFEKLPNSIPKQLNHFAFPPSMYKDSLVSTSLLTHVVYFIIMMMIFVGIKWHFIVVLICSFLMTNDIEPKYG